MAAEILKELEPLSTLKGGPLQIELLEYVKGRPNVLVKLPAESGSNKWVTFAVCCLINLWCGGGEEEESYHFFYYLLIVFSQGVALGFLMFFTYLVRVDAPK